MRAPILVPKLDRTQYAQNEYNVNKLSRSIITTGPEMALANVKISSLSSAQNGANSQVSHHKKALKLKEF